MNTKICYTCKEEKELIKFQKEGQNKDGRRGSCKNCTNKRRMGIYYANDNRKNYQREYMKDNRQLYRDAVKKYRIKNPEKVATLLKEWKNANKEHVREYERKRFTGKNSWRNNIRGARRKASLLKATPVYADHDRIAEIYKMAKELTMFLEIPMQVDHVIPLQSKIVCGFHVDNNLRIVDMYTNGKKSNHYKPRFNI